MDASCELGDTSMMVALVYGPRNAFGNDKTLSVEISYTGSVWYPPYICDKFQALQTPYLQRSPRFKKYSAST
jgi:hypothetical protein